ncbi:PAS domain-containing protein [Sphingomonas changnyeongensis]|uniref:PAS domain-containing protein n=1 Tax=Sphingomonas changnyeongensis TaxID=2698679 RepID=UPI00191C6162|nr:hypothetical protein [Sphingomonas changnyeongensis]
MDEMRGFDERDELLLEDEIADAPPPVIGGDERRMHVRAYNYWVSLLGGRAYPSIEDLDPASIEDFGPNSVLLDFTAGIDNPRIAWLGRSLREESGAAATVRSIAEVPPRSLLSRLTDHYLQIIANRAPVGFEAEFVNKDGLQTLYRGILMPFSSDNDSIDFVYGVINWKHVAADAMTEALSREIHDALKAAPRGPTTAPVWADGPHAAPSFAGLTGDDDPGIDDGAGNAAGLAAPAAGDGLWDWLASARDSAEQARGAQARAHGALYAALGRAYDFALVAEDRPEDYQALLAEEGLTVQARAPMTPVVKLVFGADYDKTRLTEYAAVLTHARRIDLQSGELPAWIERFAGGLKGVVAAERALRAGRPDRDRQSRARASLRQAPRAPWSRWKPARRSSCCSSAGGSAPASWALSARWPMARWSTARS